MPIYILAALTLLTLQANRQPSIGGVPSASLGARDIVAQYKLPPLLDRPSDGLWRDEHEVQVLVRAHALGLNVHSATEAWMSAPSTYQRAEETSHAAEADASPFHGTKASELNALLAQPDTHAVLVAGPVLEMDVPILITRGNISLNLSKTHLHCILPGPYGIQVRGAADVRLSGGVLDGQGWGLLIAGSQRVIVRNMEFNGLTSGGIVVTGSDDVVIWGNQMHHLGAAPLTIHGATHHAAVANNEITGNVGGSNWHAGILVTDRNIDMAANPRSLLHDDNVGVQEQRIDTRLTIPEDNVIAYNHIADNLSSGIYSDGAARNVYVGNRIERNSKEGMCLDNGSTANVVALNTFEANGKRWGKTDEDLKRDFIFQLGRMPDGTSRAKVPGLSIDNAAYNQVLLNEIDGNFGGGVKMVRTAFYNLIGLNTLSNNNEGSSAIFHFFGIELGAAPEDVKVIDLNFTPSRGNEIFNNIIEGSHYAGIFFADGSNVNSVFDNTIFGATDWAMESVKPQPNDTFNNLTNLRLRNVGSGLDPNLLKLGQGQFDVAP